MPGPFTNHANVGQASRLPRGRTHFLGGASSVEKKMNPPQKSNKTERFRISFDFAHAVPTTYDDAAIGRSILATRNFSGPWTLEVGLRSTRRSSHPAFLHSWFPQRSGRQNETKRDKSQTRNETRCPRVTYDARIAACPIFDVGTSLRRRPKADFLRRQTAD